MSEVVLKATPREHLGKSGSRKLRREGFVPGVYYIQGKAATHFSVDAKTFRGIMASDSNVIDIDLGKGIPLPSIVKEIQVDPVSGKYLHIDFLGVKLDEKVVVEVPIHIVGTAAGAKAGGIQQVLMRHVEVECLPLDIPEAIDVDVSALEINDTISVETIKQENVTILSDPDSVIVSILPPRLEVEEEVVEAEEGEEESAEPEVVGKGKKEESEEESGKE
jgi:large subunit ribosomal protein L25